MNSDKSQSNTRIWPQFPYKGLNYYESQDIPIFAGRDKDLEDFVYKLSHYNKRIVILQGRTGCGKSSFLRANVIPFLEGHEHGFQFLKTEDKDTTRQKALFIRSTNAPLIMLSDTIYDFLKKVFTIMTPVGERTLDLSKALLGCTKEEDFRDNTGENPEQMLETLNIISDHLPKTLVIIIDQAEEVLTIKPGKDGHAARSLFFQFLSLFSKIEIDIKVLIAIRTEYFGIFSNTVREYGSNMSSFDDYYLKELVEDNLIKAITRPTSFEDYKVYGCPRDQYKFSYGEGLPEMIAKDLENSPALGGLLPVMQIVCSRLYRVTKQSIQDEKEWIISKDDYKKLGKLEVQVEEYLDEVLTRLCKKNAIGPSEIKSEIFRWKNVLLKMKKTHVDGTVTTDLIAEDDLYKAALNEECIMDFKKAMRFLSDDQQRIIIKSEEVNVKTGLNVIYYRLGHDAIGLALENQLHFLFPNMKSFDWKMRMPNLKKRNIVIISDLHIGAGVLDDFDDELESCFCDFLVKLSSEDAPVELVINGDFLDFVQANPWEKKELRSVSKDNIPLCYTEEQSVEKLIEIHKSHENVFRAIGDFLGASKQNQLTILPGNHDADFFWKQVRDIFSERIYPEPAADQVRFFLEQQYFPPDFPNVCIEHGHQYDPINSFQVSGKACWSEKYPPIFKDVTGKERLYECIGTRFLNKFLNELDSMYPFVDNIKPFGRFLSIFGTSALVPGYGPLKAAVAVWAMLKDLITTLSHTPRDILEYKSTQGFDPRAILKNVVAEFTDTERKSFIDRLRERNYPIDIPLSMIANDLEKTEQLFEFLAENFDIIPDIGEPDSSYLSTTGEQGMLELTQGFFIDETKELTRAAGQSARQHDMDIIVMGHTHEAVNMNQPVNYINTGCWTRFYHFGKHEKTRPWSFLKTFSYEKFPYQLNYVEIVPGYYKPVYLSNFRERFNGSS